MVVIKNIHGEILYKTTTAETVKEAVEEAVKKGVSLRRADLRGKDLREADLGGADLREADLREADLGGADFREADLDGAKLGANWDHRTVGIQPAPEGELIGWEKKADADTGKTYLVKLRIPAEAERSCATTRRFRCEYAEVLEIEGADRVWVMVDGQETLYEAGKIVRCREWDPNRWNECSGGIHFFLTREEAES